jgi:hypothetical protein
MSCKDLCFIIMVASKWRLSKAHLRSEVLSMCYFYSVACTLHCLKFIQWERYLDRIFKIKNIFQRCNTYVCATGTQLNNSRKSLLISWGNTDLHFVRSRYQIPSRSGTLHFLEKKKILLYNANKWIETIQILFIPMNIIFLQ